MKELLKVSQLKFKYGKSGQSLFSDLDLRISSGEFVGLVGPSGCGKSTLAQILAGHLTPQSGQILLADRDMTGRPNRKIILLSQESDLFPWLTVEKHFTSACPQISNDKVQELLLLTGLIGSEKKYPYQLSGGMKKRLSLARALAVEPSLLILDETFNSLDEELKKELFFELKKIWQKTGTAILLISHDEREVQSLTQRKIEMTGKGILQSLA